MANAAQGVDSRIYVKTGTGPQNYNSGAETYEYVSENLASARQLLDTGGIRGTRSLPKERTRTGIKPIGGTLIIHPSPADLAVWLPRIMGSAASGTLFELGNTFSKFGIFVDRVTDRFEYTDCVVARADFRCQPNAFLELALTIIGGDETRGLSALTTPPSLGVAANNAPYVFHDSQGNVQIPSGTAREIFDIAISIDNFMDARFVNAVTVTSITPSDRLVSLSFTCPFDSSHSGLHPQTTNPGASWVQFTNGNMSLRFDFTSLQGPDQNPVVGGKAEIVQRNDYIARSSGTTLELSITNDSTA